MLLRTDCWTEGELLDVNHRTAGAQLPRTALLPAPRRPLEAAPRAAAPPVRAHPPRGQLRPQRGSALYPPSPPGGRRQQDRSTARPQGPRPAVVSRHRGPAGPYVKAFGNPAATRCEDTLSPPFPPNPRSLAEPPSSISPPSSTLPAAASPQSPAAALPLRAEKVAKVRGATRWNRGRAPPPCAWSPPAGSHRTKCARPAPLAGFSPGPVAAAEGGERARGGGRAHSYASAINRRGAAAARFEAAAPRCAAPGVVAPPCGCQRCGDAGLSRLAAALLQAAAGCAAPRRAALLPFVLPWQRARRLNRSFGGRRETMRVLQRKAEGFQPCCQERKSENIRKPRGCFAGALLQALFSKKDKIVTTKNNTTDKSQQLLSCCWLMCGEQWGSTKESNGAAEVGRGVPTVVLHPALPLTSCRQSLVLNTGLVHSNSSHEGSHYSAIVGLGYIEKNNNNLKNNDGQT